jgi:hypothetical protein
MENLNEHVMSDFSLEVLKLLRIGKSGALTGKQLATLLGEKDTRQIRLALIELIEFKSIPIVGDATCGYFIAENVNQGVEAINRLTKTLKSTGHHRKVLERAVFKSLSGQMLMVK